MGPADPVYFASPAEFRCWLQRHGASARELAVGATMDEAQAQALAREVLGAKGAP